MKNKKDKFKEYITSNIDKIYRFAFTYIKNEYDAEDVVSESVRKGLEAIESLKNEEYMGTWFYRIMINTANTYLKSKSNVTYLDEALEETMSSQDEYHDVDLYNLIMRLDKKYRTLIVLRFYEDMTLEQISTILDENINTVKTRLYKALDILKQNIKKEEQVDERFRS